MNYNRKGNPVRDIWFGFFVVLTIITFILSFTACGRKEKNTDKRGAGKVAEKSAGDLNESEKVNSASKLNMGDIGSDLPLPDNYPKEILPLSEDANIINVRQYPQNNGLGIIYVSGDDLNSLLELNKSALSAAKDLVVMETDDGYMLMASLEDVNYTIVIGEGLFDHLPEYKGKQSVMIEITGMKGLLDSETASGIPTDSGKPWPPSGMAEVPELPGYIGNVYTEDNVVRLEITVDGLDVIKHYIDELKNAGFSFDLEPDTSTKNIEFLAFKNSAMLNFAYKDTEKLVFIEYSK
jgi:hypothetical protein